MEARSTATTAAKQQNLSKPAPTTKKYLLQIKTLTNLSAADELKAELILAGFNAHIETSTVDNRTCYRVLIGPFKSEQIAKQRQADLVKQNIYGSFIKEQ